MAIDLEAALADAGPGDEDTVRGGDRLMTLVGRKTIDVRTD